jgi:hypothetical protein
MRGSPRSLLVAALALALGLVAAFSCKTFDLPNQTCDPSHLHGGMLSGDLTGACNRCLEDHCCDEVGTCEHTDHCTAQVSLIHACVLEAGPAGAREEEACASRQTLVSRTPADDAYRCMRDSCGNECGLPVCRVDPAALLIQTADCDGCFASSCCGQLNACYASRACKLTVECIIKECGGELGASLAGAPIEFPDGGIDADAFDPCASPGAPNGAPAAPSCVRKCLCEFKDNDQGLRPRDDAQRPPLLALAVYVCGQKAGCGMHCPKSVDAASDGPAEAASQSAADAGPDGP